MDNSSFTNNPEKNKSKADFSVFYKTIEHLVPDLENFAEGSIMAAECQGLIDRGYFGSNDLLDEVYMNVFKNFKDETDIYKLKIKLYRGVINKLERARVTDVPDDITTNGLLKEELKTLSEKFTMDADGDTVLLEDMDDISYQQKQGWSKQIYLDQNLEKLLVDKLELNEASLLSNEKRGLLGTLYATIPVRSKTVVELALYANLSHHEIAEIMDVPETLIDKIIFKVKERFKLL